MSSKQCVIGLDLGTTGVRSIAFDQKGVIITSNYQEIRQSYPNPGWVEQDPLNILNVTLELLHKTAQDLMGYSILTVGITNQRETTVLWNSKTGLPIYPAIVWQDIRTTKYCASLKKEHFLRVKEKTGLFIDAYFSATKIKWILDNVPDAKNCLNKGILKFGTIDSWIIWNLTGGTIHATDTSNASRTLLFNINTLKYDDYLLNLFAIPPSILPQVKPSNSSFGSIKNIFSSPVTINAVLGDQQASFFAHSCGQTSIIKNTYGTGLFMIYGTGNIIHPSGKLINTIGWTTNKNTEYAVEGSVFTGGSVIQWLRDELQIISSASQSEPMATSLSGNNGVYFVPAFSGLGAPHWDPYARGAILGLTRGTTSAHIVRAALESMAYQALDLFKSVQDVNPRNKIEKLCVDGGACSNDFLMQFQSDMLQLPVERPEIIETTAFGVAGMAGISCGFWDPSSFRDSKKISRVFYPKMSQDERNSLYNKWKEATKRSSKWETPIN
ncbi:glycerol kinase GlpK [bacterium]|jgi:glycerol kinase|nr:glycerol kinase GlpK [bacterium]